VIETIDVYRVSMPLVYPFRTAFGDDDSIESILVRMGSGDQYGWGESSPWRAPAYSPECAATAFIMVRDFLAPRLLGQSVESGEDLQAALSCVKGNPFAKAVLDLAWWDLQARRNGMPLWQALGGTNASVQVGADFGVMETVDDLIRTVAEAVAAGYPRIKLKYRPGWDLPMISAVRKRFPDTVIHIDCNSAYRLHDLAMFKELDDLGLAMIEQPLAHDDLIDHATLQEQLRTPICLDESITSPAKAVKALKIGACGYVNIKPGRVGGLTNALEIHRVCADAGVPCWVGGMLESAVGASHCLALATLPNMRYPADIFPSERFYKQDLGEPVMRLTDPGRMKAADAPGIGATPNQTQLKNATVEQAQLQG